MKYLYLLCFISLVSISNVAEAKWGRCNSCYTPTYYAPAVHQTNTVIVEREIVAPERVVRYREIKGLRLVDDGHGQTVILLGDKALNLAEGRTQSIVTEINPRSVYTERIISRSDVYGNKTVTVEKEISK